jgi:uncharacterized protein (TIGR01777 family)
MAIVLITGGTGMIGTALTNLLLSREYDVIILSRNPKHTTVNPKLSYAAWDPSKLSIDSSAIQKADYIVNLAGANVGDKRWTAKRKKEIIDSRVKSAETLVKALKEIPNKVKAVVQAAGVDWYPADPSIPNKNPFVETDTLGDHFLGQVCEKWESGIQPVTALGKRLVILRTGMVLGKTGGALDQFERPVRFGIAAILSSGEQIHSWIHLEDITRMYTYAIENEALSGVYNAVAPSPVSNKTMMLEIAQLITGRFYLSMHVPAFVLKLLYGELGAAILKSTTVSCGKISRAGFQFLFPAIEPALYDIEKN